MNKYKLPLMKIGEEKYFPLAAYDKIRMACHFNGKRHGMKFSTKKMKNRVMVTREW